MNRSRIVAIAVLFAIIGTVIPLTATLYFSWVRACSEELDRLHLFSHQAIARANLTIQESMKALRAANNLKVTEPCSDQHVDDMRRLVLNTRSVDEMGFFQKGYLVCSSWGTTKEKIKALKPEYTNAEGLGFIVHMQPRIVSLSKPMAALHYKNYNVLVDPDRFADVVINSNIGLAVATQSGYFLNMLNSPNLDLVRSAILKPLNGIKDNYLVATTHEKDMIGVVIEPRQLIFKKLYQQLALLLPLGVIIAAIMVGLVIWLSKRRLSLLGELTIAVENKEFIVFYQPIVELATGLCIGAEALVRWRRMDGSFVRPDFFIPIAEESGLIRQITDQVIESVFTEMKKLLLKQSQLHIAINLCADDIKSGRVLPVLKAALVQSTVQAKQIWLEATERGFMDVNGARETIVKARELGFKVAIDDFGTGYSSLSYLQGFPLDALKIDKSFVDTIGTDSATSSVTPYIISMAKSFDLKIIAEGIEKQAQADYLLAQNVEYGQGFLFGKPMPANDFIAYFNRNIR